MKTPNIPQFHVAWRLGVPCLAALLATLPAAAAEDFPKDRNHSPDAIRGILAERQKQQETISALYQTFHDFQFSNQIKESGILFKPQIVDDVGRHNKPVHYDHGMGIAVADLDGDGRLDIYFVGQLGGNQLWRNLGEGRFEDITAKAGVGLNNKVCVAAAFADTDNDGDQDLFVTTVRMGNVFFENTGGGRFREVTQAAGLEYVGHSSGVVFFDFNRDGLLDLFVANVGKYTSNTRGRGGYYIGVTNAFSGHLYPELNESSLLYKNLGGNKFSNVSGEILSHTGWSGDASVVDINGDDYPELYVLNMQGDDRFYYNAKGTRFTDVTARHFPKTSWGAMGIKFFDFNNDGRLDLYVTDMHSDMTSQQTSLQRGFKREIEKSKSEAFCTIEWDEDYLQGSSNNVFGNAFYLNMGNGRFAEVSDEIGAETFWPWGVSVGDLNADGFQDVFVASGMGYPYGYGMNALLLNERGRRFLDAEFLLGIEPRLDGQLGTEYFILDCSGEDRDHPSCQGRTGRISVFGVVSTRSSLLFDLDDDGDLDIVTNEMIDHPQVFVSNLSARKKVNHLKVQLTGSTSNRDGLGATVKVTAGGVTQTRYHDGKSGYLSQSSSLPLYFGLGDADSIDQVQVHWPSGKNQSMDKELKVNTLLKIEEPK